MIYSVVPPEPENLPEKPFHEVVQDALTEFVREHGRYPSNEEIQAMAESFKEGRQ